MFDHVLLCLVWGLKCTCVRGADPSLKQLARGMGSTVSSLSRVWGPGIWGSGAETIMIFVHVET